MALDYEVPRDKRLLYWLGDKLIDYRHPVSIVVLLVTALLLVIESAFFGLIILVLVLIGRQRSRSGRHHDTAGSGAAFVFSRLGGG